MAKVYILINTRTAGRVVGGVFSTKKDAQAKVKEIAESREHLYARYEIYEEDVTNRRAEETN
jgi:hypothetical protein